MTPTFRKNFLLFIFILILTPVFCTHALATQKVKFVSVGWTGVTIKTELGVAILDSLGYRASNTMVSVPIAYQALDTGDADIFLGNWMPSMATLADQFFEKGTVKQLVANMPGAQYTLAAPSFVVDGGLKDFSDIAKYADKLDHKIYGIEEGNDGNLIIQDMIDKNLFGLGDFKLVASSEAGMLAQVRSYARKGKWIIFLGWSPHYMNEIIDMKYLTGSTADTFGENGGTATVYTNIRTGFDREYPNVALFLNNFKFPVSMMNAIMTMLHEDKDLTPTEAGLKWVAAHPEVYKTWFEGVKTVDGEPGLPVFEKQLKKLVK